MTKSVRDILVEARKLIEKPENWTRYQAARDAEGNIVAYTSEEACKWCALGAVWRVVGHVRGPGAVGAEQALEATLARQKVKCVVDYNDSHTHKQVLKLYDRAISRESGAA